MDNPTPTTSQKKSKGLRPWMTALLLIYILGMGAFLRFNGINWDEDQHLHPDERFLTMVSTSIAPVNGVGEYFDTANSSLNPARSLGPAIVQGGDALKIVWVFVAAPIVGGLIGCGLFRILYGEEKEDGA